MKKLLLISVLFSLISSCEIYPDKSLNYNNPIEEHVTGQLSVMTFDSCEYIVYYYGGVSQLEHKGNCSNQIHKK